VTTQRRDAPPPHLQPHLGRIVESVLFLVNEAHNGRFHLTQYDIVKSFFLADTIHLNRYGRPITYDNYVAMENGPAPSKAYNVLKQEAHTMRQLSEPLPWTRRPAPELGRNCNAFERPARQASGDVLSPSDRQALATALGMVKTLGFNGVKKLTHDHRAYQEAWKKRGNAKRHPMLYELLFEKPNPERARELSFVSKHL
jgi:hypothetical protein